LSQLGSDDKLCDHVISILIDPRSNYTYVNPELVDKCGLSKELHAYLRLVNLATCTKKRGHHWVRYCAFDLNGMPIATCFNVLPLGSYILLLGMDWLYLYRTKVDCYDKAIKCVDDNGQPRVLQSKNKATSVRMVITMQEKCSRMKGCKLFAVHISSDKGKEVEDVVVLRTYKVLQQFKGVFPKDITELPHYREEDFSMILT